MKIVINGKSLDVADKITVSEALKAANTNPETVLVKRNGALIPSDEALSDGDELELINVISGG